MCVQFELHELGLDDRLLQDRSVRCWADAI
ncbi:MAG: hypothetical protein N838_02805 [Thiohalocapsa sp. PB-PSB1]|nr:MAG: hypothetical protein N838_02805 [Thiohalocapsa sp. PB-PSB1]